MFIEIDERREGKEIIVSEKCHQRLYKRKREEKEDPLDLGWYSDE